MRKSLPKEANCLCRASRDRTRPLSSFMVFSMWLALRELPISTPCKHVNNQELPPETHNTQTEGESFAANNAPLRFQMENAGLQGPEPTGRDNPSLPHNQKRKQSWKRNERWVKLFQMKIDNTHVMQPKWSPIIPVQCVETVYILQRHVTILW